jgi:hypothetical protein
VISAGCCCCCILRFVVPSLPYFINMPAPPLLPGADYHTHHPPTWHSRRRQQHVSDMHACMHACSQPVAHCRPFVYSWS